MDIETLSNMFLYVGMDKDTQEWNRFIIHEDKNEIKELIEYLNKLKGSISFNGLNFDSQVVQFILDNHNDWLDLNGGAIADLIYRKSQQVIERSNNKGFPEYPEWKLKIKQLDLFKIWHFDNKAKMTSLKWVEYSIDLENIEEMPISHKDKITVDQFNSIVSYCENDIKATYEFYKITTGNTEHPLYKNIDKVQLRKDIQKEFGIQCLNYNDVRIGDEINKISYCKVSGINKKDIPKPPKDIKAFSFRDCYPSYMEFKTDKFNNFINMISNCIIDPNKKSGKQEFILEHNGTKYTIAKGGIHSQDEKRIVKPTDNEILRDADIGLKIRLWPN